MEISAIIRELFNFESPDAVTDWSAVDDSVMGGRSASQLLYCAAGFAVFTGTVSLAHRGGFASIRSCVLDLAAPGAQAICLECCGDGRHYKLNLRTDDAFDGINYQAGFEGTPHPWRTIHLPVAAFSPTFRGRRIAAPPLDPARIRQVGLMIAGGQAGAFELRVRSIRAT